LIGWLAWACIGLFLVDGVYPTLASVAIGVAAAGFLFIGTSIREG
jgi:hypothetical protein